MSPHSPQERKARFDVVADEVFEPLQRYLRRRATFHDADDVLDDVLLTIWRRLDDVPADAVLPWSYAVARRALSNHRRAAFRQHRLISRLTATAPSPAMVDPIGADEHPELVDAMGQLSEDDREVLRLWAWEQLEPREIAIVLGRTPNAVSVRLTKAKKRLAVEMSGKDSARAGHKRDEHTKERGR